MIVQVPKNLDSYTLIGPLRAKYLLALNLILVQPLPTLVLNDFIQTCKKNKINVTSHDEFHIKVNGFHEAFTNLFNIQLYEYSKNNKKYYANKDEIELPTEYNFIENIVGLDNLDFVVGSYVKILEKNIDINIKSRGLNYFTPPQIANLYNYPTAYNGAGQTIGIIELGGGYKQSDLNTYFQYLGLNPKPTVIPVLVDGAKNNPDDSDSSAEVVLDIQIAGAIANASKIIVYFAPNTVKGFYDAIYTAINDTRYKPSIISISWGATEDNWARSSLTTYDNLFASAVRKGINIFCASGDNGSSDGNPGLNVDFPSSSPNVIACGGTKLNSNGSTIQSEIVWNDLGSTGGGISKVFNKPAYQHNIPITTTKRCVPDLAANASPYSGYLIYMNGNFWSIAGTSAVSPLLAGLTARLNQHHGSSIGFINPKLYTNKPCFDVIVGNNGAYQARVGYDLCTGIGRVIGTQALTQL